MESVSPRMLYTLARRHDEYDGENYEGSSCRGALKGWFNHGVCLEPDWPYLPEKANPATYGYASRAAQNTLGIYYRIDTRSITDLQAAIAQHRAVFVSAFPHSGWDAVPITPAPKRHADLPLIAFDGRRSDTAGHAFALIGFNAQGFILQNSWGKNWGADGFAVLGYLDWLAHAMDAWVVSLGVPGVIAGQLAVGGSGAAGLTSADRSKWWDTGLAYRHSVVLGNDGRVSRYLTEDEPPRKLQQQACVLPDDWFAGKRAGRDGGLSDRVASVNLHAPACSVAFANRHYAGDAAVMERLHLEVLTDEVERRDTVGPIYRKSLLYLVSNALEADLHTPILGLDRVNDEGDSGWDGSSDTGEALAVWRQAAKASKLESRTRRIDGPRIEVALGADGQPLLQAATHGGFDSNIALMTHTLERITGGKLALPVEDLRGF